MRRIRPGSSVLDACDHRQRPGAKWNCSVILPTKTSAKSGSPGFMVRDRAECSTGSTERCTSGVTVCGTKSRERGASSGSSPRSPDRPITRFSALRGQDGAHKVLMGISHHPGDAVHLGDFFRRALGITAGHQNAALGVPPMDSAHELTHFRVRRGRDRTSIQDRYRAFFHARELPEARPEATAASTRRHRLGWRDSQN